MVYLKRISGAMSRLACVRWYRHLNGWEHDNQHACQDVHRNHHTEYYIPGFVHFPSMRRHMGHDEVGDVGIRERQHVWSHQGVVVPSPDADDRGHEEQ